MYFSEKEVSTELKRRQNDKKLGTTLDNYLGFQFPIPKGQFGFLARHVATGSFEELEFATKCQNLGLTPVTIEYTQDNFSSNNPDKVSLVKLKMFEGYGRNGGMKFHTKKLVSDVSAIEKKPLSEIKINSEESLVSYHHQLRKKVGITTPHFDLSNWLKNFGKAEEYYRFLFAAMSIHGVLFENFESKHYNENDFRQRVIDPSLEKLKTDLGISPLIVDFSTKKEHFGLYPFVD